MKLYYEIDIRPYLRMWKLKDNGTSNKKVMKKFYELFAQPSYMQNHGKSEQHCWQQLAESILSINLLTLVPISF